jgi:Fur family transcriptional regulator, ferric uptake regulator
MYNQKKQLEPSEILNSYLEEKGFRKTQERYLILEEIYKTNDHFDIESLFQTVIKKQKVSKATIYNTIDILIELNLIKKHYFLNKTLYEKSFQKRQHNHLICEECDKVLEFCDPRVQNIINSIEENMDFVISEHSLNFYGKCNNSKKCKKI